MGKGISKITKIEVEWFFIWLIIIVINRMIKKNTSERRFNTAAARIMLSSKLPSDFFVVSREKDER